MSDRPAPAAWASLGLLALIYAFNFLDRTLIYILFAPIRAELALSDLQLALLGTTSFVMFYTLLGLPFGRLADRVSRTRMIAVGLVIWSVASGLGGFATGFWSLFLCRVMVGVGEATLAPAATSLIAELFPAERRATAQSIYSAGIPLGAAAAFFLGGALAEAWGWRMAFQALGFPGLLLAVAVLWVPERPRIAAVVAAPPVAWTWMLQRIKGPVLGYALLAVAANSLSIWVPSAWLHRVLGLSLAETGQLAGLAMLVAGVPATALGGAWADRWEARAPGGRVRAVGALAALTVPLWLGLLLADQLVVVGACYVGLSGLGLAWLGPAAAEVQERVGPAGRGAGVAAYVALVNVVGYGVAPPVIGWLSDAAGTATDPSAMGAVLLVCPAAAAAAAAVLLTVPRPAPAGLAVAAG